MNCGGFFLCGGELRSVFFPRAYPLVDYFGGCTAVLGVAHEACSFVRIVYLHELPGHGEVETSLPDGLDQDRVGVEEGEVLGDVGLGFSYDPGYLVFGHIVGLPKVLESLCLVYVAEIEAFRVLVDPDGVGLGIRQLADVTGDGGQAGAPGSLVSSVSGDDRVAGVCLSYDEREEYSVLPNALCELDHGFLVDGQAGVELGALDHVESDEFCSGHGLLLS